MHRGPSTPCGSEAMTDEYYAMLAYNASCKFAERVPAMRAGPWPLPMSKLQIAFQSHWKAHLLEGGFHQGVGRGSCAVKEIEEEIATIDPYENWEPR